MAVGWVIGSYKIGNKQRELWLYLSKAFILYGDYLVDLLAVNVAKCLP